MSYKTNFRVRSQFLNFNNYLQNTQKAPYLPALP